MSGKFKLERGSVPPSGDKIRELALECVLIDIQLLREEMKAEIEGHRQRNLILDSQIEHLHRLITRFEAIGEAWAYQVQQVADISAFDVQLRKLTAAILQEAAHNGKDPWEAVQ